MKWIEQRPLSALLLAVLCFFALFSIPLICFLPSSFANRPSAEAVAVSQLWEALLTGVAQSLAFLAALCGGFIAYKQYLNTALPHLNITLSRTPEDSCLISDHKLLRLRVHLTATNIGLGPAVNITLIAHYGGIASEPSYLKNLANVGIESQLSDAVEFSFDVDGINKLSPLKKATEDNGGVCDLMKLTNLLREDNQSKIDVLSEFTIVCKYFSYHQENAGKRYQQVSFNYKERAWRRL